MEYKEHISASPDIMMGKPVIKGTRITVELILKKLSEGMKVEELMIAYPDIRQEDVLAVLAYSADVISREEILVT